ncbi:MAG: helix-turn-helix domain-containing protein, partial [Prevotellaceae bacterium]|nr:helix-turn-helix domain-containing protein [Prevotellaceae bacterium]
MKENHTDDMESRIIFVAKKMFIEKGFTETSMSDIAAQVGINRPGLHYYFRTKERMFQAVFGQIVLSFLPEIKDIMIQQNVPFDKRIENIIDAYYGKICKENPDLP